MPTALETHQTIANYARKASQAVRRKEEPFAVGQWARQGDIYIVAIQAIPKDAKKVAAAGEIQLAQGQTLGSRHMLQPAPGLTFFRVMSPGPLDGGYIEVKGRAYISHPEHAHLDLPPGKYEVRYQQDLAAEEIRAVRD